MGGWTLFWEGLYFWQKHIVYNLRVNPIKSKQDKWLKSWFNLPESLVESAQRLGKAIARDLSEILVNTLEVILPAFSNLSESDNHAEVSYLLDSEVIELANLKMDTVQNQRLGELQAKGKIQDWWTLKVMSS